MLAAADLMEGAAMDACGTAYRTGGGLGCCICWIHAGWTLYAI